MSKILLLTLCLWAGAAQAGIIELGASGNYRLSRIDDDNKQEMTSYTGTISYYFWEMSALELSYTQGKSVVTYMFPGETTHTYITTVFELIGLDLVLTLGDKQSVFLPYIKVGGAYIRKEIAREVEGVSGVQRIPAPDGIVPSAGIGFKIRFTQTLSLKVGVDAWTSPPDREPVTVDYAGRAGLSWMF
jgi:hypothetical protein